MKSILMINLLFCTAIIQAQENDSLEFNENIKLQKNYSPNKDALIIINKKRESLKSFIFPGALITYGLISLESDALQNLDNQIKEEIWNEHPHKIIKIDNYLQYAPAVAVFTLNAIGIKGKNNFRDRTIIYLMANTMMGITVQSLKATTKIQRPDGFGTNAFPSGHTATAFVAAEFLRQEYKDKSPWYGIAGYAAATTTAYLRMYNNKHWFRDLLPGAGIGIISTKMAYYIYPTIKRMFFKDKPMNTVVMPYYLQGGGGISLTCNFDR